jgi:hypothetical protein
MKSVLISIKPKWCERILSGEINKKCEKIIKENKK